jgi:hypothetical protein
MNAMIWIVLSVVILLGIVVIYTTFFISKKQKNPTDYRGLFNMGIVWLLIGLAFYIFFGNSLFLILGMVVTMIGLANNRKWDSPIKIPTINRLTMLGLIVIAGIVFLTGLLVFYG